jgi:hypothetical protein
LAQALIDQPLPACQQRKETDQDYVQNDHTN